MNSNKESRDELIEQLINDKHYQINEDGSFFTYYNGLKNRLILSKKRKLNLGTVNKYSVLPYKGKNLYVHRIIYRKFIGKLSSSLVINHKDGNKKNNSITNLELVTQKENVSHALFTLGVMGKLSTDKVVEIRNLYAKGSKSQKEIARIYNVSKAVISAIICDRAWNNSDTKNIVVAPGKTFKKSGAKLNWTQVNSIREMHFNNNVSKTDLAKIFNLTRHSICNILSNRSWKKVANSGSEEKKED